MATIALNGNTFGGCLGAGSFSELGSSFEKAKKTTGNLKRSLSTLKQKIEETSKKVRIESSDTLAKSAESKEEIKNSSLTLAYNKLDEFITDVSAVDMSVHSKISSEKDDFYDKYSYLKPDSEKDFKERASDKYNAFVDGLGDFFSAVGEFLADVGEWLAEHWKEILIGLAFIVVGALITVFTAGAGTAFWAAFGAAIAKGICAAAISAAIGGAISAGCTFYQCKKMGLSNDMSMKFAGKAFGDGAASGFMAGGIGFAAGAGILGVVGKGALAAKSLGGAIVKGALFGSGTGAITSPVSTVISTLLKNEKIDGGALIQSTITGIVCGGIVGGIMGGIQFKLADIRISKIEKSVAGRTDLNARQQGKLFEKSLIDEFKGRFPNSKFVSQCRLKSDLLINKQGNASYSMPDLLVENGNGKFTNYDFKWGGGQKTFNQNVLTGHGNTHVFDTTITGNNLQFSSNVVPKGTPFIEVHAGEFNSIFGVPLNTYYTGIGSSGLQSGISLSE